MKDIKPMVERCKEQQAKFVYEHVQMKEMIRRFDECLSEKANKMGITELEHRIGEGFLKQSQWAELLDKFSDMDIQIQRQLSESREF